MVDSNIELDEELGYIELYRSFAEQIKELEIQSREKEMQIVQLRETLQFTNVPIVLTEGKTDCTLLKIAIQKLGLNDFESWKIQPISSSGSNNTALQRFLTDLGKNMNPSMPVIGMFDRDTEIVFQTNEGVVDLRDCEYIRIARNIYAFALPVPHNREETNDISIEHYFTDSEIKTELDGKRLFMGNEFYSTGVFCGDEELYYKGQKTILGTIKIIEHESKCFVTRSDGSGDYSISKAIFADCIKRGVPNFNTFSFSEFNKIFNILQKIKSDSVHPQAG